MRILNLTLFLFLISCASGPKKSKDLADIKDDDFKSEKAVTYKSGDDQLANVKSQFSSVSNKESIQRIYKYDGDIELKGEMGTIAKLCYEKDYKSAHTIIKAVNKKYVKNPIFWNHVGTCFLLEGSRRKALLFFNKALSIKDNYAPALNNLGVMYMYESDFSRALVAFKKAKSSKSFSVTPRFNLANLYLNFGLYNKSINELNTLLSVSKDDVDVLNMLATAHLMKNDVKSALKYYASIDSELFERVEFGSNYALALFLVNNKNKAKDVLSDIDPKKVGSWAEYFTNIKKIVGEK